MTRPTSIGRTYPRITSLGVGTGSNGGLANASDIDYDNSGSGLTGDDVQEAIDELVSLIGTGDFVTVTDGGGEVFATVAAAGTTETIDLADGNVHDITLTADCTFTFAAVDATRARSFTLLLRQDGTGGWSTTWPGSVEWAGGVAPTLDETAGTVSVLTFFTIDGGTVWYGFATGGGGGATSLDDLSDVTITAPTLDDDLRYNGSVWVNDPRRWEAVTDGEDVFVWDGDDLVHEWSTP